MNLKKNLLAFGLAAATAITFSACSDDSSSASATIQDETSSSSIVVTDAAWYDATNGYIIYPNGTVTDISGTTIGSATITNDEAGNAISATVTIGETSITIDLTTIPVVTPENADQYPVPGSSSSVATTDPSIPSSSSIANQPTAGSISFSPVTEDATESAQKLYNFLATNFGSRTVSGVQTGDVDAGPDFKDLKDIAAVIEKAGKAPALVGFDFLFATGVNAGDSWYQSYTQSTLDYAEQLWNAGGIPAFSWHWKDPSDAIDAFYTKKGNGSEYTEFDYAKGFKAGTTEWDETSPIYQQIVSDIDEISAFFKQLQDKGVAAIFRPLHESGGAWFWWSATTTLHNGAEYAALYRLVYDRMVKVNGVKNLIWVWNAEKTIFSKPEWDPGEAYYDVFSVDIYNKSFDYQSNASVFAKMKELHPGKILALSENGPIPDASLMHKDNAVWSWNMPWYETWDGMYVSKTKETVWKANLEDPCVYALEDMPGWSNYTISNTPAPACEVGYALGDLDTANVHNITLPADAATNGYLQVDLSAPSSDAEAKGNVIIKASSIDLSGATSITFDVDNSNNDEGIWFTVAFMNGTWQWAQAPEGDHSGCWINPGKIEPCMVDISTLEKSVDKDKVIISGDDVKEYLADISKIYLEIFSEGFSGTLFYDNFVGSDGTVINDFNTAATIKIEQGKNISAKIIGNGN